MCCGFQEDERDRLKIRAFSAQLPATATSMSPSMADLPDSLTLYYLPRINGSLIEINGSSIRPDSPAFVTLHRLCSEDGGGAAVYGSRERVAVCEGVSFEIYAWDAKVLRGIFRRDGVGERWKLECKVDDAVEVSVAAEGEAAVVTEKVGMVRRRWRPTRRKPCCELEEIPEQRGEGSDACRCHECGGDQGGSDAGDCEITAAAAAESVGWAVDVGIWVVCLGVGYWASKKFRTRKLFAL
ncbi:uncharacterized protein LOC127240279 [Andrographis paniculata]|uniref:uncharacterized protein LOC127240279 n=1 Tax=Andrographis paniculata TaxID=175694 RepID=UPI0021E7B58F|nr:uncharacterized protein LOC127240279 [Andrographis paniculata]